ncbi:uncharacterized protein LOC121803870 [Salvia splendens]|uniref:uncharacterized protein LOC121803870 n=1 Tax=Salvia splendens TaxID=180675 RepID=UPI001C26C8AF|nr:uncharacterized protein LOC121803870 [Salvia splendens]
MPRGGNANAIQIPPMEDTSSPYYLHPSDNPSFQLVPHVLTGSNYINWSRSICSSIMYLEDAHEIWSDLRIRFSQLDSARAYQLRQRNMSLYQGKDDVNAYFTNLRIVWDEFKHSQPIAWCICANCRCNSASKWHEYQEQECTMQFLIGLNPVFSHIRSSILSMVPIPPLSKVLSLVLQDERQRTIDGYSPVISPSMSEQPYSANAATSQSYNKGRLCSHCGKSNHTVDKCFTLHGFPPGFGKGKNKFGAGAKETKSVNFVEDCIEDSCDQSAFSPPMSMPSQEQCQQLINLLQSQLAAAATFAPSTSATHSTSVAPNMPSSPHNVPFTDTGATHHVCCDLSIFNSSSPIQNTFVNLPNGATTPVTHIGTAASQEIVIGRGSRLGNLYTLDVSPVPRKLKVLIDVWHKRLRHVSFGKLKSMSDVLNFPSKTSSLCDICPPGKQKHLPFSKSDSNAISCFDLIHCDVWGPFSPSTT